jgi:hypothetical protein
MLICRFNSVSVDPYPIGSLSIVRFVLEVVLCCMILANVLSEFCQIAKACLEFRTLEYLNDFFNLVDWGHTVFLILSVYSWGKFWRLTGDFDIPESFSILEDATSRARPFLTKAHEEYAFLQFVDKLVCRQIGITS